MLTGIYLDILYKEQTIKIWRNIALLVFFVLITSRYFEYIKMILKIIWASTFFFKIFLANISFDLKREREYVYRKVLIKVLIWWFDDLKFCLFKILKNTFIESLLQTALDNFIHVGKSKSSINTASSSSRFESSPSPFSVLKLILSGDKFLVNLYLKQNCIYIRYLLNSLGIFSKMGYNNRKGYIMIILKYR